MSLIVNPHVARLATALNRAGLRRLNRVAKSLAWRLGGGKLTVRAHGLVISGPSESWTVLTQIGSGALEPFEVELFAKEIQRGMTVLDIGANIGFYTLIASQRVGPTGHVYAFEPDPRTVASLRANIRANGADNVTVIQKGVSDAASQREFFLSSVAAHSGLHGSMAEESVRGTSTIETVSVDEALPDVNVDVLKMDIEGEEPAALRGMADALERSPRTSLFIELSPQTLAAGGTSAGEFVEQLGEYFDELLVIDESTNSLKPLTPAALDGRRNLRCRRTSNSG